MDWVAQFEGQMLVCGLLAKAFYGEPDKVWLDMLATQRIFDSVPFGGELSEVVLALEHLKMWMDAHQNGLDDTTFMAIRDDHTRLFVGPAEVFAAPWESVYTNKDRAVFQRETVSVKNWYSRFELKLATEYNEPADHVGLQFGFLAHLSELTLKASERRDGERVKRLIDAQRAFLMQHMLSWVPRWSDDVNLHARTDLYRGLAWLARGVVQEAGLFFSVQAEKEKPSGAFKKND